MPFASQVPFENRKLARRFFTVALELKQPFGSSRGCKHVCTVLTELNGQGSTDPAGCAGHDDPCIL